MMLLLDLGNSRIKWVLAECGEFQAQGAVASLVELAAAWANYAAPDRVIACSVQSPEASAAVAALVQQKWQQPVTWLISPAEQMGVRNHYHEPATLGADRWAALLGARALFPGEALVLVSAGTALVVDALTAEGDFLGGMIAPGYRLMQSALAQGTARLPLQSGQFTLFPLATADAVETGCLSAMAGAVSAMVARLSVQEQAAARIVLSGGDAARVAPLLTGKVSMQDNLVLRGLLAYGMYDVQGLQG